MQHSVFLGGWTEISCFLFTNLLQILRSNVVITLSVKSRFSPKVIYCHAWTGHRSSPITLRKLNFNVSKEPWTWSFYPVDKFLNFFFFWMNPTLINVINYKCYWVLKNLKIEWTLYLLILWKNMNHLLYSHYKMELLQSKAERELLGSSVVSTLEFGHGSLFCGDGFTYDYSVSPGPYFWL